MAEQKLEPVKANVTDKEGNELYNLNLKTKVNSDGSVSQGLVAGDHIVIEKVFLGGFKSKFGYSIKAQYDDKRCSFFLRDDEYDAYENTGGVGDKVKIIAKTVEYVHDKKTKTRIGFDFEKAE